MKEDHSLLTRNHDRTWPICIAWFFIHKRYMIFTSANKVSHKLSLDNLKFLGLHFSHSYINLTYFHFYFLNKTLYSFFTRRSCTEPSIFINWYKLSLWFKIQLSTHAPQHNWLSATGTIKENIFNNTPWNFTCALDYKRRIIPILEVTLGALVIFKIETTRIPLYIQDVHLRIKWTKMKQKITITTWLLFFFTWELRHLKCKLA